MKKEEVYSQEEIYKPISKDEKIRVAFLFQIPSQWPAWESLYFTLVKDNRFEVKLYLVTDKVDKSKQQDTAEEFLRLNSIMYQVFDDKEFQDYSPHIALLQTPYEYALREFHLYARTLTSQGIRIIYIPYGIELVDTKSARHDHFRRPLIKIAWRIYTASEKFVIEYQKYCENAKAVRGLGLPRFDILKNKERFCLQMEVKRKAGLRKIIVWHVHFCKKIDLNGKKKQVTPYLEEYIKFADGLKRWSDEVLFIFLPHPRFGDDAVDIESNEKSMKIFYSLNRAENVYIDTSDDYRPSLLNANAIISDRSSLAVEATAVKVPVLYMLNPDYEEPIFPPIASIFDKYEKGISYYDMEKFVEGVINNRLSASNYENLPNFDGMCADRIVSDIIKGLFEVGVPIIRELRLIIFGTGFIYKTMYKLMPEKNVVIALTDNDKSKWGMIIDGVRVIPPSEINDYMFDKVVICAENVFADEIEKQLIFDLEIPRNKVAQCDYLAEL